MTAAMTAVSSPIPAAPAGAEEQYCRWGWPITVIGTRMLASTGPQLSAVELPVERARKVHVFLGLRLLAGPVIALPGTPCRWLLLAESAEDATHITVERLHGRGAIILRSGTLFPLPPSSLECGVVTWLVPPAPVRPWLPPFSAVAAAVRSVTDSPGQL